MKKIIWTLLFVIISVAVVLAIMNMNRKDNTAKADTKKTDRSSRVLPVSYMIVQSVKFDDDIVLSGNLISNEEVEIRSEITGKVISINFKEGSSVAKGALLVKINDDELQAQRKKLQYRQKLAIDNEYRQKTLLERNGTSKEAYDIAFNELQVINADLELLDAQIRKTEIRAPFSGVIGLRYVSKGSYITPETKIAYLQSINPIKVEFGIPQKYQSVISNNQTIIVSTHSSDSYSGKVFATESKLDESSRSLLVRALVANTKNRLKPGEFVTVTIPVKSKLNTIMIPSMALVPDIKGETVYLFRNGTAVQSVVSPGKRTAEEVEILAGINTRDTLITSGIIQLRNKMKVKLKEDVE